MKKTIFIAVEKCRKNKLLQILYDHFPVKNKLAIFFVALTFNNIILFSQIIISTPSFPTINDSVIITFNAALGNAGLKGFTGDVYAHTGVITSASVSPNDWKHAPVWGDNSPKYKLQRIAPDLYQLRIVPSIKSYYNIADNEKVLQLAFVFRSADKTKEGKTETNGDIFYPVISDTNIHMLRLQPTAKGIITTINEKIPVHVELTMNDSVQVFQNSKKIKTLLSCFTYKDTFSFSHYGKTKIFFHVYRNNQRLSDSVFVYIPYPLVENLPSGIDDGITYHNDSSVTLCIVAPNKNSAVVVGDFNNWEPDSLYQMKQTPNGQRFWITLNGLIPNNEYAYQFIIDNITIADPYARKILDPWNDKYISSAVYPNLKPYPYDKTSGIVSVLNTKPTIYRWKYARPTIEKKDLIIYELLVRDFHSSHSYQAIIDSLSYLLRLGINAIELMPIMEFEGNESWGYNPSFYFAPDKYYGTDYMLKKLIDTCHSLGIAVILDIVLNHSFGQCPLVQLYWDKLNNRPAANSPWYNPIAKHDFNVGYDFNHESIYTKQFSSKVLKYWITEYNIDGYRFDLSKGFTQKNTLGNVALWGQYDATRINILKAYADTIWSVYPNAYIILEHFAENSEEKELVNYGMMVWNNLNHAFREGIMGWNENSKSDFSWASYKQRGFNYPSAINYIESHDEERLLYSALTWSNNSNPLYSPNNNLLISLKRAELAAVFYLIIPGPKMMWQFGELGYDYSINYNGRTGNKPIRWDYMNNPYRKRLYSIYSLFHSYRKTMPIFQTNQFTLQTSSAVKSIFLSSDTLQIVLLGNFDVLKQQANIPIPSTGWWYNLFTGDSLNITSPTLSILLEPGDYLFLSSKKLVKPNIISAPVALNPSISSLPSNSSTLNVNYVYYDANGDYEGATRFQWYKSTFANGRSKIAIPGANTSTYKLTDQDYGYYIFAEIIPVAQTGYILEGIPVYAAYSFGAISNSLSEDYFVVYPNPCKNYCIIQKLLANNDPYSVIIYDLSGKVIYQNNKVTSNSLIVSTQEWRKGTYFIKILSTTSQSFIKKIIVD